MPGEVPSNGGKEPAGEWRATEGKPSHPYSSSGPETVNSHEQVSPGKCCFSIHPEAMDSGYLK